MHVFLLNTCRVEVRAVAVKTLLLTVSLEIVFKLGSAEEVQGALGEETATVSNPLHQRTTFRCVFLLLSAAFVICSAHFPASAKNRLDLLEDAEEVLGRWLGHLKTRFFFLVLHSLVFFRWTMAAAGSGVGSVQKVLSAARNQIFFVIVAVEVGRRLGFRVWL